MTDKATQIITDAMGQLWTEPEDDLDLPDWHALPGKLVAALKAARIELVELPEPKPGWYYADPDDGDEPDHTAYGDEHTRFRVATWNRYPDEIQVSYEGEPFEPIDPDDARALAAALLAAAHTAETQHAPQER